MFLFLSVLTLVLSSVGCAADRCRPKQTVNYWKNSAIAPVGQSSIPVNPVRYRERHFSTPVPGGMMHSSSVQGTDTYVYKEWQGGHSFVTVVHQRPYRYDYRSYSPNNYYPQTYLDPRGPKSSHHRWPR